MFNMKQSGSGIQLADILAESDNYLNSHNVITSGEFNNILKGFFQAFYGNAQIPSSDVQRVALGISNLKALGSAGTILICAGDNCPYNGACDLYNTKIGPIQSIRDPSGQPRNIQHTLAPEGKPCPLEAVVISRTREKLINEFLDLDTSENIKDMYLNDLCQLESYIWRCNMLLSYDKANMLQNEPGAVTSDGRVIYKHTMNPILEILDKLHARKAKLLNDIVKSPKERYKKEHAIGNTDSDVLSRRLAARKEALMLARGTELPDVIAGPLSQPKALEAHLIGPKKDTTHE